MSPVFSAVSHVAFTPWKASLRGHVLFYFKYYINTTQNTKPFYFFICIYIHFLAAKGAIYYVAIAKVIFSTANVVYVSGGEDNV